MTVIEEEERNGFVIERRPACQVVGASFGALTCFKPDSVYDIREAVFAIVQNFMTNADGLRAHLIHQTATDMPTLIRIQKALTLMLRDPSQRQIERDQESRAMLVLCPDLSPEVISMGNQCIVWAQQTGASSIEIASKFHQALNEVHTEIALKLARREELQAELKQVEEDLADLAHKNEIAIRYGFDVFQTTSERVTAMVFLNAVESEITYRKRFTTDVQSVFRPKKTGYPAILHR